MKRSFKPPVAARLTNHGSVGHGKHERETKGATSWTIGGLGERDKAREV